MERGKKYNFVDKKPHKLRNHFYYYKLTIFIHHPETKFKTEHTERQN